MKIKKKKSIVATAMIFGLNISTANDFYVVKKGDTLTSILHSQHFHKPIYGKHGSLAETLKLNPKIQSSRGNKIFPKMRIALVNRKNSVKIMTADSRQQTADSRQQTADSRQQTADSSSTTRFT